MKTLVIGDIHGNYKELMEVLELSGYEDSDRLISLGDFIDYGPQSKEVVEFLCTAQKNNPNNVYIRGNHENQLIYSLEHNSEKSLYSWMDALLGRTTLKSYGSEVFDADDVREYLYRVFPPEHIQLLEETKEFYDEGEYHFTHIPEYRGSLITVHGHEHEHKPIVGFHRISLAVDYGVAVWDMDKGVIYDSEGREFKVSQKRLHHWPHI